MSFFSDFKKEFNEGVQGNQSWIPIIHNKLNKNLVYGKNMYWIFGGMPGSGKTSIVDSAFVLEPYLWWKRNKDKVNINPYWIYRSMERKVAHKIAKWTAYMLFVEHRVLIDVPTLLSWPNKKKDLTPELIALVESYHGFFDELLERIIIIDGSSNPTGIYNDCVKFIEQRGHYEQIDEWNKQFVYDNPNDVIFHITDHIGE